MSLKLRNINVIAFPDWLQPEASLFLDLEQVIRAIATHPDRSQMTLVIDTTSIFDEAANLLLSSVVMNLLMQEDLDVSEGPDISLVEQLDERQWEVLLPCLHARMVLENENQEVIIHLGATNLPCGEINSFNNRLFVSLET